MAVRSNQLRIIGGEWRGRKFQFPDAPGLRPTPDRVRETVFNWLMPVINGATCLDLFAGSGALGLEALSRGAAHTTFVERNAKVVQSLQSTLDVLQVKERSEVVQLDGIQFLNKNQQTFDIIFLDPPYQSDLLLKAIELIETGNCLNAHAYIYMEMESHQSLPAMPENWKVIKDKKAGDVHYFLAENQE